MKKEELELRQQIKDLLKEAKPSIIYFYATWCSICRRVKPILDELKASGVGVILIDCEEYRNIGVDFYVRCVPTSFVYGVNNHSNPKKFEGFVSIQDFQKALEL
jgi:thiol-disulfide isomerase/thioredoxin